jgi:holliday junction DNA helicase RuvA
MIVRLSGKIVSALPHKLVIDVNGVGYEVSIPLSTYDKLAPQEGDNVTVNTHLHIRETAQTLYGFASNEEKDIFLLLIDRVSGIGPATALSVLSSLSVSGFKTAIANADTAVLSRAKGLGKKTAERIILELRDKVGVADTWKAISDKNESSAATDAELALISLGYKQAEARSAIKLAVGANTQADTETLIKLALRALSS